jgi:hypothetical protein
MAASTTPAFIRVWSAAQALLESAGIAATLGLPALGFRYMRNRPTLDEERPCVASDFISAEPAGEGLEQYLSNYEQAYDLAISLKIDTDLETEDSGLDPTGLLGPARIAQECLRVLKASFLPDAEPDVLNRVADSVSDLGIGGDDELFNDAGRLVNPITIRYRVLTSDPTFLIERD